MATSPGSGLVTGNFAGTLALGEPHERQRLRGGGHRKLQGRPLRHCIDATDLAASSPRHRRPFTPLELKGFRVKTSLPKLLTFQRRFRSFKSPLSPELWQFVNPGRVLNKVQIM